MDGAREYYKWSKSQKSNTIWFRSDVEFKKQNKQVKGKKERPTKKQTLREQTDVSGGGREWVKQVLGIKEGTCPDEHRVLYKSVESLYCTPGTRVTLC